MTIIETTTRCNCDETAARVLIVEDMAIIALDIEDMIQSAVRASVQVVSTVGDATKALDSSEFDFVVLDYSVGDHTTVDLARRLKREGVHFIIISGYGRETLNFDEMRGVRVLDKPIRKNLLSAEIHFALTRRAMRKP